MSLSVPRTTYDIARKWSDVLVETGTHEGYGVVAALLAGFKRILTCELDRERSDRARVNAGAHWGNVTYFWGDSGIELVGMLREIGPRAAILLDAHAEGPSEGPLLLELQTIRDAKGQYLVMVDDYDLVGDHIKGITQAEVRAILTSAGTERFIVRDGHTRPKSMLIALPKGYGPHPLS